VKLQDAFDQLIPLIEAELKEALTPPGETLRSLYGMMHYHMGWADTNFAPVESPTGKRIRPLLTLLVCRGAGGDPLQALPAAAAVELVHNFSLIHDDIEDRSATRRHRLTVWKIWGESQAINVGDALLSLAHVELSRLIERGIPLPQVMTAARRLQATCVALCQGQYLDMSFESRLDVDIAAYLEMIQGKTGALLSCAAELGALVAGAAPELTAHYSRFGLELGLAFQVQDDFLGIWGEEKATGKPTADDIRQRKKTLPIVFALNQSDRVCAGRLRQIYAQDSLSEGDVVEVLGILAAAGAKLYIEEIACNHYVRAVDELKTTHPQVEAAEALQELADFITQRRH
jgi:geranylgeranyl diphosphate synthase type I